MVEYELSISLLLPRPSFVLLGFVTEGRMGKIFVIGGLKLKEARMLDSTSLPIRLIEPSTSFLRAGLIKTKVCTENHLLLLVFIDVH